MLMTASPGYQREGVRRAWDPARPFHDTLIAYDLFVRMLKFSS